MNVDILALVSSFSMALDLAENRHLSHAKRTGYIAVKVGERLGIKGKDIKDLYVASLLHDIGVTTTISKEHYLKERVKNHCLLGSKLVAQLPVYDYLESVILYHHENWDGSGPYFIGGDNIPIYSQIIFVADQLEIRYLPSASMEKNKTVFRDYLSERSGKEFSPRVVETVKFLMETEAFWLDLRQPDIENALPGIYKAYNTKSIDMDMANLLKVGGVFSSIIDNKSKFTKRHSQGLAELMIQIARKNNYSDENTKKLELAALLHDLGKLSVSNDILEKNGRLTFEEFQSIKRHPYYTKHIIRSVQGMEEIASIAGEHHEKLDGTGYPEKLNYNSLSHYSRVMAVGDIFQALTEFRPYREGLTPQEAVKIIKKDVEANKLCYDAFSELNAII
ncbi:HD domain-containing phosphohydrolase [Proteinivorax hydrogeniformans]|uniref:HD domain-containing phosphohydrolase n=1 Tax=Proteinivorax hydrogeniformans TaxID=1826727 RepID=A0AAU8HW72_9FIRM